MVVNHNGGGAISPYCIDHVYVSPYELPDREILKEQYLVLEGACGVIDHPAIDNINWSSERELVISINATLGAGGVASLKLKGYALGGKIRIVYDQRR